MKTKIFLIVCMSTFISVFSQNNLDRVKAGEILKEHFKYPNIQYDDFRTNFYCLGLSKDNEKFLNEGLIEMTNSYFSSDCWNYEYKPTYELKKYVLEEFKNVDWENTREVMRYILCVRNFKEVTGIRFNGDKTEATVEFTIFCTKVTPFGRTLGMTNNDIREYEVKFVLYDDGWRIKDNSYNYHYTYDNYPYL